MKLKDFMGILEKAALDAGAIKMTRVDALAKGLCIICGEPALPKCFSDAGRREYYISCTCERCFDKMFAEED